MDKVPERKSATRAKWYDSEDMSQYIYAVLPLPRSLPETPSPEEIQCYCNKLNSLTTYTTPLDISNQLAIRSSEPDRFPDGYLCAQLNYLSASRVHSGNPYFYLLLNSFSLSIGTYPPLVCWLSWFMPAFRKFWNEQSSAPRYLDELLGIDKPKALFRDAKEYIARQAWMLILHNEAGKGLSITKAAEKVFDVLKNVSIPRGMESSEKIRKLYYGERWADFFKVHRQWVERALFSKPQFIDCFSGFSPDMEVIARYAPTEFLTNHTHEGLQQLAGYPAYLSIYDIPDNCEKNGLLTRMQQNNDPLAVMETMMWADQHGCYPPSIMLAWLGTAINDFMDSGGERYFSECFGLQPGIDPFSKSASDLVRQIITGIALVNRECNDIPITATVESLSERIGSNISFQRFLKRYGFLRGSRKKTGSNDDPGVQEGDAISEIPNSLRQAVYRHLDEVRQSGFVERASTHPEEYLKIFTSSKPEE
jgi:hypothetical protein